MNGDGVRPRKLWHWGAIALIGATVWHNPSGSAEFAVTVLDGAGTIFGGALNRAGYDGESDYFTDPSQDVAPEVADGQNDDADGPPELEHEPGEPLEPTGPPDTLGTAPGDGEAFGPGDASDSFGPPIEGTADRLVLEVVELHEFVEAALQPDPDAVRGRP